MKNKGTIITILLVVILGGLAAIKLAGSKDKAAAPSKSKGGATNATAYVVRTTELENNIVATGTVLANEEVELKSEVSGKVEGIYFKEGGRVNQGQLLVKLNDADLLAQLQKQRYLLEIAEKKHSRISQLLEKEGVSQEEFDISQNEINTIKADMALLQAQIAKTRIKAPFGGVVGLRNISEGSYLSPAVTITTLQDIEPVKIDFSIPEKYAGRIAVGDKIQFSVQGLEKKLEGEIYAIEPKIDINTRSVQVRALCPNKGHDVLPGAFASIELVLKKIPAALLVPTESIIPELKGQKVMLVKGGKATFQPVETGIRTEKHVQITGGLQEGDTVVTTGMMMLRPGMPVNLTEVR